MKFYLTEKFGPVAVDGGQLADSDTKEITEAEYAKLAQELRDSLDKSDSGPANTDLISKAHMALDQAGVANALRILGVIDEAPDSKLSGD